jgi:hypothetical protein
MPKKKKAEKKMGWRERLAFDENPSVDVGTDNFPTLGTKPPPEEKRPTQDFPPVSR